MKDLEKLARDIVTLVVSEVEPIQTLCGALEVEVNFYQAIENVKNKLKQEEKTK